jgi:hypothetical protein
MKITGALEDILCRSARPVAIQCTEAQAEKLEEMRLAKIVSRNPTPFVEITDLGRMYLAMPEEIEWRFKNALKDRIDPLLGPEGWRR